MTAPHSDRNRKSASPRYSHQIMRVLPTALALWIVSRLFFDAVTRKPVFWSSREAFVAFAWNGAFFVPIMVLVLIFISAKYKSGNS